MLHPFVFNDLVWPMEPVSRAQYDAAWCRLRTVCDTLGLDVPSAEEIEFQATELQDIDLQRPFVYAVHPYTFKPVKINFATGQCIS